MRVHGNQPIENRPVAKARRRFHWLAGLLLIALGLVASGWPAWASALVCAACGQPIGPGAYLKDQWGACYHRAHAKVPRCVYCARGITAINTGGGVTYPDGRTVCNLCHATAVTDLATAREAEARVRRQMDGWGLHFAYGEIPLHLVDQGTLNRLFGGQGGAYEGRLAGLTTKRWLRDANGHVRDRKLSIAMLDGMPLPVFEKTVAHELMHAWMFLDGEPEHAPGLEEGVCNLASYYVLQEQATPEAAFNREAMFGSKDPTYGAGLRRAIRYVQRHQFVGLVKMLRASRDFPPGS